MKILLIFFISLFFLTSCADLKTARRASERGDLATANQNYLELAEFGIPQAQIEYAGFIAENPRMGDRDKAIGYLEKAVESDPLNRKAYLALAKLYETTNPARALAIYKNAYRNGDQKTAYLIGKFYERRNNSAEALHWLEISLQDGDARAAKTIGLIYEKKNDVRVDLPKALYFYRYAKSQGVEGMDKYIKRVEDKLRAAPPEKKTRPKANKPKSAPKKEAPDTSFTRILDDYGDTSGNIELPPAKPLTPKPKTPKYKQDESFDDYNY